MSRSLISSDPLRDHSSNRCTYRDEDEEFQGHIYAAAARFDNYPLEKATICVGPENQPFEMYTQHITSICPVIKQAFDQFNEAESHVYRLPEEKPSTFQYMYHWMTRGQFRADYTDPVIETVVELFNLADRLMITHCQNFIINRLSSNPDLTYDLEMAVIVGTVTDDDLPATSHLRRYVVDKLAFDVVYGSSSTTDPPFTEMPAYFLFFGRRSDLAREIFQRSQEIYARADLDGYLPLDIDPRRRRCDYHDHESGYVESRIIEVIVGKGQEQKIFYIHKKLIEKHSKFFLAMDRGCFKETCEESVKFVDDDPAVFALLVCWIYDGELGRDLDEETLIGAYVLADRLMMTTCMNCVHDEIRMFHRTKLISSKAFDILEKFNGSKDSKLARYFVDQLAYHFSHNYSGLFIEDTKQLRPEYLDVFERGGCDVAAIVKKWFEANALGKDHIDKRKSRFLDPSFRTDDYYHVKDEYHKEQQ